MFRYSQFTPSKGCAERNNRVKSGVGVGIVERSRVKWAYNGTSQTRIVTTW